MINLNRFHYGQLPGRSETQAFVEALKRTTDGTFVAELANVFRHVCDADLEKSQRWGFCRNDFILLFTERHPEARATPASDSRNIRRKRGYTEMSEIIHEGFVKDVFVLGEVKGKVETIISILNVRFKNIPTEVNQSLGQMTDPTALDSLVVLAATCDSIGEFAEALR